MFSTMTKQDHTKSELDRLASTKTE